MGPPERAGWMPLSFSDDWKGLLYDFLDHTLGSDDAISLAFVIPILVVSCPVGVIHTWLVHRSLTRPLRIPNQLMKRERFCPLPLNAGISLRSV